MEFVYEANPARVIFGRGARGRVAEELDRLGISRAIVLSTPPQAGLAAEFARDIGHRAAVIYPGAAMHTPVEVTEAAMDAVRSVKADGILSAGGGSTIGLGKAIAYRTDLPQLAVVDGFKDGYVYYHCQEDVRSWFSENANVRNVSYRWRLPHDSD